MATDVSPKERSQAAHALTALCLAHSAITLEGLTETKLDWIWQDAEFLLIPSLSLPDVQGVDASCTTMMQYLLAERYERGDFFVIGQPDGADALSGAHAMASVEEFLKAQGGH